MFHRLIRRYLIIVMEPVEVAIVDDRIGVVCGGHLLLIVTWQQRLRYSNTTHLMRHVIFLLHACCDVIIAFIISFFSCSCHSFLLFHVLLVSLLPVLELVWLVDKGSHEKQ